MSSQEGLVTFVVDLPIKEGRVGVDVDTLIGGYLAKGVRNVDTGH